MMEQDVWSVVVVVFFFFQLWMEEGREVLEGKDEGLKVARGRKGAGLPGGQDASLRGWMEGWFLVDEERGESGGDKR